MELKKHIFLTNQFDSTAFTSVSSGGSDEKARPARNRNAHAEQLSSSLAAALANLKKRFEERTAVSLPTKTGCYLEFESQENFDLTTKSLEDVRQGVRLLNIKFVGEGEAQKVKATVYVPAGKEGHFLKKIEKYQSEELASGQPKNGPLVESIEEIRLALLEALWTDPQELIPSTTAIWCEAWLRVPVGQEGEVFGTVVPMLAELDIGYKENYLEFPERGVILIKANRQQLTELVERCDFLAEFRIGQETASFWVNEANVGQREWVDDLLGRLQVLDVNVSVCLLDSGVNNGHELLHPLLSDEDCLTVNPDWGTDDHEPKGGHGTLMAGIAGFGNIEEVLNSREDIICTHRICSVKVVPRPSQQGTPIEFWGDVTSQAISRAELNSPETKHIYCLSLTSSSDVDRGRPSSWSGAIDNLCFGEEETKRLVIISGGNVEDLRTWQTYPDGNLLRSIENPAQSWNALTVGAYTEKVLISDETFDGYEPLAPFGALSPFSSTSYCWEAKKWPHKPDVVFEGGNILKAPDGRLVETYEDYCLLSTSKNTLVSQFDLMNATSAAAAQAAFLAAKIAARYEDAWPETIRGLMVHSASWTDAMVEQLGVDVSKKTEIKELLRVYGYGKPSSRRALYSMANGLTFVVQDEIQPFDKNDNKRSVTKDMHFYDLPWPKDELIQNPDVEVTVKVTLSYFIEPGPGEIGWRDKYRYRSHGLCFELNSETESKEDFLKRINKAVREEDERPDNRSDSDRWVIGVNGRTSGSIHSDSWKGTAAQIAACNMIGVYPLIGWWRERSHLNKWDTATRYSLIVSLETPVQDVDLYNEVVSKIALSVPISTDE